MDRDERITALEEKVAALEKEIQELREKCTIDPNSFAKAMRDNLRMQP